MLFFQAEITSDDDFRITLSDFAPCLCLDIEKIIRKKGYFYYVVNNKNLRLRIILYRVYIGAPFIILVCLK
jgi:hypothetical protein